MASEIELAVLLAVTVLGSLTSWYLGWKDKETTEPFVLDKAIPSLIRAGIAALIVFIATYTGFLGEVSIFTYCLAYLAGMGLDAGGNRLSGAITSLK